MSEGYGMLTLDQPRAATLRWAHGPFYPDTLEELAHVIETAAPRDRLDLDLPGWCFRAGVVYGNVFDFELGDGYTPWLGIKLYATRGREVWLVLPHLVDDEGNLRFERSPAFYTRAHLGATELRALAARLASTYSQD